MRLCAVGYTQYHAETESTLQLPMHLSRIVGTGRQFSTKSSGSRYSIILHFSWSLLVFQLIFNLLISSYFRIFHSTWSAVRTPYLSQFLAGRCTLRSSRSSTITRCLYSTAVAWSSCEFIRESQKPRSRKSRYFSVKERLIIDPLILKYL